MNKFTLSAIITGTILLTSCGYFDDSEEYVGGEFNSFVQKEQENSTTFEMKDNLGITDSYTDYTYRHKPEYYNYRVMGTINNIEIQVVIQCTDDGGDLTIHCGNGEDVKIVFKNLSGDKKTNKDGYTVTMLDSLKVGSKTYKDVLEIDATGADNNACDYDKAYIAANKGLIRIDLQDSISIERTSKKATERTPVD
jgi:hypothetical protein